jgi:hypothetical protein
MDMEMYGAAYAVAKVCEFYSGKTFTVIDGEGSIQDSLGNTLHINGGENMWIAYDGKDEEICLSNVQSQFHWACNLAVWFDHNGEHSLECCWKYARTLREEEFFNS